MPSRQAQPKKRERGPPRGGVLAPNARITKSRRSQRVAELGRDVPGRIWEELAEENGNAVKKKTQIKIQVNKAGEFELAKLKLSKPVRRKSSLDAAWISERFIQVELELERDIGKRRELEAQLKNLSPRQLMSGHQLHAALEWNGIYEAHIRQLTDEAHTREIQAEIQLRELMDEAQIRELTAEAQKANSERTCERHLREIENLRETVSELEDAATESDGAIKELAMKEALAKSECGTLRATIKTLREQPNQLQNLQQDSTIIFVDQTAKKSA